MSPKVTLLAAAFALVAASALEAQQPVDSTKALYTKTCAMCHGANGTPTAMARASRNFADSTAMASVADSALRETVADGKGRAMPAYKARLTPAQIDALIGYIRTLSHH